MNKINGRILFLFLIYLLFTFAFTYRLVEYHILKSNELIEAANNQQTKVFALPATRGSLLDSNGNKMAYSLATYSIFAQAEKISNPAEYARILNESIGIDEQETIKKLTEKKTKYVKLASNLLKREADLVIDSKLKYISVESENKRFYPFGSIASHVIGLIDKNGNGITGIESYYNEILSGKEGKYTVTTDLHGRKLAFGNENRIEAVNGNDLVLTIDSSIQFFVQESLKEVMEKFNPISASAVVMNPNTGEILALATLPDFNLNEPFNVESIIDKEEFDKLSQQEQTNFYYEKMWRNRVVSDTYEPGSTMKTIVSAIALEENLFTFDSPLTCDGSKKVADRTIRCVIYPNAHGKHSFLRAFVTSCNPSFIEIGQKIGKDKLYSYYEKFGLTTRTGVDIGGEAYPIIAPAEKIGPVELATLSFGHAISLPMIDMASALCTTVNGGLRIKPQIVKEIRDPQGNIVRPFEIEIIDRVISEETSEKIRYMMEEVVNSHSYRSARVEGIRVGGKSGSTVKISKSGTDQGYDRDRVIGSFVGVAPIENPEYLVMVVVDEPEIVATGTAVSAPVVSKILTHIFRHKNVVVGQSQSTDSKVMVPNLVGKELDKARHIAETLGFAITTNPIGVEDATRIVSQTYPSAGSYAPKGSVIILNFE